MPALRLAVLAALLLLAPALAGARARSAAWEASRREEKAKIEDLKARETRELEQAQGRHEKAAIRRRYKLLRKETRAAARAEREGDPQKMLK